MLLNAYSSHGFFLEHMDVNNNSEFYLIGPSSAAADISSSHFVFRLGKIKEHFFVIKMNFEVYCVDLTLAVVKCWMIFFL